MHRITTTPFKKTLVPLKLAFILAILPAFEFFFFRIYMHSHQAIHIGYRGMTDADIIYPGLFAFFALIFMLNRTQPLVLRLQKGMLLLHAGFLILYSVITFNFISFRNFAPNYFLSFWLVLAATTFFSALFVWVSPDYFTKHKNRILLIPIILLAGSKLIASHVFSPVATYMQSAYAKGLFNLIHFFSTQTAFREHTVSDQTFFQIVHPKHVVAIGVGCTGMEGASFLLFSVLVVWVLEAEYHPPALWLRLLFIGIPYMLLVNALRILIVFVLPFFPFVTRSFVYGFHDYSGWVFNFIAVLAFHRWLVPKHSTLLEETEISQTLILN